MILTFSRKNGKLVSYSTEIGKIMHKLEYMLSSTNS